jgi:hypothetical protein
MTTGRQTFSTFCRVSLDTDTSFRRLSATSPQVVGAPNRMGSMSMGANFTYGLLPNSGGAIDVGVDGELL